MPARPGGAGSPATNLVLAEDLHAVDVAALDVLDSFGARTLRSIAEMARLRGAATVIVGIRPDVAYAMVRLGMGTSTVPTALDLEEGLELLARRTSSRGFEEGLGNDGDHHFGLDA